MLGNPLLYIPPYLFFTALFLRRRGLSRKITSLLGLLLAANLAGLIFYLKRQPEAAATPAIATLGQGLLTVVGTTAAVFSWIFYRCADYAAAQAVATAVILGLLAAGSIALLFLPPVRRSARRPRLQAAVIICLGALAAGAVFYLCYPRLTPAGVPRGWLPILVEGSVRSGAGISQYITANAAAARRAVLLLAASIAAALAARRIREPYPYLLAAAAALALAAQSFIVAGNFPEAIYLYCALPLVLAGARYRRPERSRPEKSQRPGRSVIVVPSLLVLIILGLYRLEDYPLRYHPDEALGGDRLLSNALNWNTAPSLKEAAERYRNDPNTAFIWKYWAPDSRPNPYTPVSSHLAYLCLRIFPINFVSLRASMVLAGVLSVFFFYLLLRLMFGHAPAALGAFFLAVSSWQLALNRIHLPYSATGLYALICLYLFWKAQDNGGIFCYFLLGTTLAFSSAFYPTFKMVYLLLPAFLIFRIISERGYLRRQLAGILVAAGTLLLILGAREIDPYRQLFLYGGVGADTVAHHAEYMSELETLREAGGDAILAGRGFFRIVFNPELFQLRRRNYIERGIQFNILLLPFSVLGFFWSLLNLKRREWSFLALWLAMAIIPNIVTGGGEVDRRATLLVPPLLALAAVAIHLVWTGIGPRLLTNARSYRAVTGIALAGLVFLVLTTSSANYFHAYSIGEKSRDHVTLREFEEFKGVDRFLAKALNNDYPIYFLNRGSRYYLPHHEAHQYARLRLFTLRNGRFVKREYQDDSSRTVNRASLFSTGEGGGFVVIGPESEKDFILALQESHPRSKMYLYRSDRGRRLKLRALAVDERGMPGERSLPK